MKVQAFIALAGATCMVQSSSASTAIVERRMLTVLMYDYAALPNRVIRGLEEQTTQIMSRAGILVKWVQCGGPLVSHQPEPCAAELVPGRIVLRILARCPEGGSPRADILGHALTPGAFVSLCAAEVLQIEKDNLLDHGSVLPYAAAHEIGHILLGPGHGASGIMRAVWGKEELSALERGKLKFSEAEAEAMRRAVPGEVLRLRNWRVVASSVRRRI